MVTGSRGRIFGTRIADMSSKRRTTKVMKTMMRPTLATTLARAGACRNGLKMRTYTKSPSRADVRSASRSAHRYPTSSPKWYRSGRPGIGNGYEPLRRSAYTYVDHMAMAPAAKFTTPEA